MGGGRRDHPDCEALNTYDERVISGSVLEVVDENLRGCDPRREKRPLNAYVILAKRCVLLQGVPGGDDFEIVKHSEHGLGHLLDPTGGRSKDWIEYYWWRMLR